MWSCEEFGGFGGDQYYDAHKVDIANYDLVMESGNTYYSTFDFTT